MGNAAQSPEKDMPKAEQFVTVIWHQARMLTYAGHTYTTKKVDGQPIGKVTTKGGDGKEYDPVAINRKNGYDGHGSVIRLQPGENVIPKAIWEDMKTHDTIKDYIENSQLEEFDPTVKKGAKAPSTPGLADDLEAYSYKDAVKLIGETMSVEKLNKWRTAVDPRREKADQIKEAITQQIARIAAAG
jgi:hypothetical protein